MGGRPRCGDAETFDGQVDGDHVASAQVGGAFDHGGDGRVHPARTEGDHGLLAGGEPAAGRPRGNARGLAEQTEYGSLVFCESAVGARERQDRLVGTADRTFWDGPHIDVDSVEQVGYLVEAGDHEPFVGVRGLVGELGVYRGILEAAGAQDLHRPVEVGVRDVGFQDLRVCGRIEPPAAASLLTQDANPFR